MTDVRRIFRSVGAQAVCALVLGALSFSAAPAQAGLFDRYVRPDYDRRTFDAARPEPAPVRKRPKTKNTDIHFTDQKVPPGPLHIIASIAKQRVTVFMNGVRIAEAPISTGVPGHPTPMGIFAVISKARHHRSNIYSGAPMPYMHRITWSGIALHQGPLPGYPASHGCIRLPESFASKLWAITKLGARVIVTRDEAAPVAFESPRLFVPKKPAEKPATEAAAPEPVVAMVTGSIADSAAPVTDIVKLPEPSQPVTEAPKEAAKRKGPVQVFVSRKEAKLYVRQGFAPLFEAPVTVADPDQPWGTHIFTVMDIKDDKASWTALTVPSGYADPQERHGRKLSAKQIERLQKRAADLANAPAAAQALERFELSKEAVERISELLAVGSALIVSDNALSDETGLETDFIVATH